MYLQILDISEYFEASSFYIISELINYIKGVLLEKKI